MSRARKATTPKIPRAERAAMLREEEKRDIRRRRITIFAETAWQALLENPELAGAPVRKLAARAFEAAEAFLEERERRGYP